jgi:hypothetical protein
VECEPELNIPVQAQSCAATPVVSIFVSSPEGKEELDVAVFLETLGFVCMESKQLVNAELESPKGNSRPTNLQVLCKTVE